MHLFKVLGEQPVCSDTPPNVGPIAKQWKKKKVGVCSLTRTTSGVRGHVRALGWD